MKVHDKNLIEKPTHPMDALVANEIQFPKNYRFRASEVIEGYRRHTF